MPVSFLPGKLTVISGTDGSDAKASARGVMLERLMEGRRFLEAGSVNLDFVLDEIWDEFVVHLGFQKF